MQIVPARAFEPQASCPPLIRDEIHLWFLTAATIDDSRKAIAIETRKALTRLLVLYGDTDSPPPLDHGPYGKPFLPDSNGIEFNLSHCGRSALIAFARGQSLGVDLECLDRRQRFEDIADRYFTQEEARGLRNLPEERHVDAFLRLWTCKEAVLKALGVGLSFGLDRLSFKPDEEGKPDMLASIAPEGGVAADWQIVALTPAEGLVGAIAWQGPPLGIRAMRWSA